jgi:hypothetical protein
MLVLLWNNQGGKKRDSYSSGTPTLFWSTWIIAFSPLATYTLMHKLMQLERSLQFLQIYFGGSKVESFLVALVGRFNKHAPEHTYQKVFESKFGNKIPILKKLYQLEKEEKTKQLYFIS